MSDTEQIQGAVRRTLKLYQSKEFMMPNQSGKHQDFDQIAAEILIDALGYPPPMTPVGMKNPDAVESGPMAGVHGRAEKLVANRRLKPTKPVRKSTAVAAGQKLPVKPE